MFGPYRLFGLTAVSAIELPEALRDPSHPDAEVRVSEASVPRELPLPEKRYDYWEACPGAFLMHVPGIVRLEVRDGREIRFERLDRGTDREIRPYLLGSGFAAILHQRGTNALHAAGIVRQDRAYLFCGRSGAGKSTIAAHLSARSGGMLCDDLAALSSTSRVMVQPGLAHTRLDTAALRSLRLGAEGAAGPKGKWELSTADRFVDRAVPVAGIFVIERKTHGLLAAQRLDPRRALQALRKHSYRRNFTTSDRAQAILNGWARISGQVPVWHIARPLGDDTMLNIADLADGMIARTGEHAL